MIRIPRSSEPLALLGNAIYRRSCALPVLLFGYPGLKIGEILLSSRISEPRRSLVT